VRYAADPPKVEEIIAVMRAAGDNPHGRRPRGLIVILWRAGLRIQEALFSQKAIWISVVAPDRDPAPTWAQQPRHHLRLPAGNRQRRDQSRPSTPGARR
jgi:hypothetical protein